jgi:hypothetical protein
MHPYAGNTTCIWPVPALLLVIVKDSSRRHSDITLFSLTCAIFLIQTIFIPEFMEILPGTLLAVATCILSWPTVLWLDTRQSGGVHNASVASGNSSSWRVCSSRPAPGSNPSTNQGCDRGRPLGLRHRLATDLPVAFVMS